jgi:4-amino-4-deoxy-L-arabinose transferase-like glycosyltransferase
VFYPEDHGREGLFINLSAVCVYFFGNTTWAVQLPTVLFGILNVWIVYVLSTAFFSPPIALLAAFFMATSLWQVMGSRFSNRANAASFFLALTLYLAIVSVERLRQGKPVTSRAGRRATAHRSRVARSDGTESDCA